MLFSFLLVCTVGFSQTRKAVSILGDSYSTFENYLQPDTNAVWYFQKPRQDNDVRSVNQTWWYKFIQESGYRLCVNNSFRALPSVTPVIRRWIILIVRL